MYPVQASAPSTRIQPSDCNIVENVDVKENVDTNAEEHLDHNPQQILGHIPICYQNVSVPELLRTQTTFSFM